MFCSQCGTELAADSIFCFKCGKPISAQSQIAAPSQVDSALPKPRPLEPAPQPQKQMSPMKRYIIRAWNGEERLWIVYWLYNVLGIFLLRLLAAIGVIAITAINAFIVKAIVGIVFLVLYIAYFIWAVGSLWKCAFNVKWKGWGYLGRAYVLMFVFALLGIMVSLVIPLIHKWA
ncbi:MAG: zinc ribbon domain-containing protein [Pseudomonadota bacterium]